MITRLTVVCLLGLTLVSSCKKSGSEGPKIGAVTLTPTISTDGSGLVTFQASAENAVKYTFHFGDELDNALTQAQGNASHTYTSSGSYAVRVSAISGSNDSTKTNTNVTVQVNEPAIPTAGYSTPTSYSGKTLVWSEEFNGDNLNTNDWNFETGPFNDELEYYKQANTSVSGGYLIIHAKLERTGNLLYSSSRLTTQSKHSFKYGRVDIRAMAPKGQGMFPALWMLGNSFSTIGWPKCGEIDIMETICGGGRDSVVYGTAHWDSLGHVQYGGHRGLHDGHVLGDQFHVYSIVWSNTKITWYIDDVQYQVIDTTPVGLTEFQKPFFFIINLAVGGGWAGPPNNTTTFPQRFIVDYIRVFQ